MSEYHQKLDVYQKLSLDVNDIINTLLEVNHIKISNMAIRIKTEEALRNKAMYKNKYAHLDEITDILGVRIITLFENDVDTILELLENTFEVCEIVDKRKAVVHFGLLQAGDCAEKVFYPGGKRGHRMGFQLGHIDYVIRLAYRCD